MIHSRFAAALIGSAAIGLAMTAPAAAAPADVDLGFGTGGAVAVHGSPSPNGGQEPPSGEDMAIAPGGEIYAAVDLWRWCPFTVCPERLMVRKFQPGGTADPSFGTAGISDPVEFQVPARGRAHNALALAPDGKPVAAIATTGDVILARFGTDGRLDPSLGGDGTVTVDFGADEARPKVVVDSAGRIVLAVVSELADGRRAVFVARFLPDGSPDPGFAGGGRARVSGRELGDLDLAGPGAIWVGVPGCCGLSKSVLTVRLREGGAFDRRFSRSGWRKLRLGPMASLSAVIALPRGRVQLVGTASGAAFAARLRANGRLDRGYGRRGIAWMRRIPLRTPAPQAAVDRRGRLVVVGAASEVEPFSNDLIVLRRLPNGRPDRGFGNGGWAPVPYYLTEPLAVETQPAGGIVLFATPGFCIRTCPQLAPLLIRFVGGSGRDRPRG